MRFNFRQISALATSALMVGMTAGVAAAANYPAPFVSGGSADVAVVYGTGAGVSSLDLLQAGNIQTNLQSFMTGTTTGSGSTTSGGDSFKFEKTSTKFHLGDNVTAVVSSSLDDDELPTLLADGVYVDDDNDEFDYTQTIAMGANLQLTMFEDNDYVEDEPTVGIRVPSSTTLMTYTLSFSDAPTVTDMETTTIPIMSKPYYILDITSSGGTTTMTLLDSAESVFLDEGETETADGHSVSISFISSTEVRLAIDGVVTNTLSEGETQKLSDGSYVGIKDILFNSKDTGVSSVEFSIGSGKLVLASGSEIEINDDVISGLTSTITNTTTMSSIALAWAADEDVFITEESSATMPGFEVTKLSFGGLTYPDEEEIAVEQGGSDYAVLNDFPLKDGPADIAFLYGTAGAFTGIGKDSTSLLITSNVTSGTQNISFDSDTDDYFVGSWSDGDDAESYLMRATNFVLDGTDNKTDIEYYKNGDWTTTKSGAKGGDTFSLGNAEFIVGPVTRTAHSVYVANNSANTGLNGTLYSATGLKIYLPHLVSSTGETNISGSWNPTNGSTAFILSMLEEDQDGNKGSGDRINVTMGWTSGGSSEVEVSSVGSVNTDATSTEIGDTDVFRDFTYSALATEILLSNPSSGENSLKLVYHGDEVTADVYITSPETVVTTGTGSSSGSLGNVVVKDSEVASVSSKNLIVVGGSCINSVAAKLVGGARCGSSWTSATGVGSGQFLIESYADAYTSGKIALLVAGYDAADTTNAGTYLRTKTVDTAAGKKYIGTTSTSAELQVA